MAKLTPETILRLSEPVEQVYSNIVDSLLVNMAKHFNSGYSLSTQQWEIRKLAEMGQLNKESVEIIASLTGQNKELITAALENAVYMAAKDIEPELKRAVKKGAIQNAAADNVLASQSIIQSLQAYEQQALEKMNLVNTTMLESTLAQYRKIITNTAAVERQMQAVQQTLNIAAGKVITGAESRQQALRQSLSQVHKEGITGFYDRAGRKWSPEAYVNMDIRTTVHNTAIEAVKIRQQDYGVNIFRVSRHSGARPLCYPYQGRYFSWDNSSGTFYDGEGKQHRYYPLSSTSYGKPAGLFGINCGHHPITVIPGVSIPRDRDEQNKGENDRAYAESQEQRRLEREIRYSKQKAAMMEAAGDKEGFEQEALKIKEKQSAYNAFCKRTGRTKRLERTQIFEYNKGVSSKANVAVKRAIRNSSLSRNNLSSQEKQAITDYVSAKSYSLNEKLRFGDPLNEEESSWVKNLDNALDKLPDYQDTVYRSISGEYITDKEKFEQDHAPGNVIIYSAYTSTSKQVYDENMDIQFIIKTKHGKDISAWNSDEQEVLHKRETVFYITKREGNIIYMEEV